MNAFRAEIDLIYLPFDTCAVTTELEHTMPRFTVVWDNDAIDELARIWMTSSDHDSIRAAADKIDALLSSDPGDKGQAHTESLRTLTAEPLEVLVSIRDLDRLVRVLAVRHVAKADGRSVSGVLFGRILIRRGNEWAATGTVAGESWCGVAFGFATRFSSPVSENPQSLAISVSGFRYSKSAMPAEAS